MKLALYLPNFRDKVTVKELEDLTALTEELDFDSVWTLDQLSNGRVNVGIGSGWMPEEFAAASAAHIFPKRHKHVRETIEIMQGIWTNDLFEYHGEFADFDRCGFGHKPLQDPMPIWFSAAPIVPATCVP